MLHEIITIHDFSFAFFVTLREHISVAFPGGLTMHSQEIPVVRADMLQGLKNSGMFQALLSETFYAGLCVEFAVFQKYFIDLVFIQSVVAK